MLKQIVLENIEYMLGLKKMASLSRATGSLRRFRNIQQHIYILFDFNNFNLT